MSQQQQIEELEQTYEALKVILEDEDTFNHVCTEVFKTIDADGSGSLERSEIRNFINNICMEMGMKNNPDDKTIQEVFAELDEDGSDDISTDELKKFLRKLFVCQKDEVGKALGRK
jgi:Ca2+-binding EF-hand superfamily protein